MRIYARVLAGTGLVLALGVCLLCTAPGSAADKKDDKKDEDKPSPAIEPVAKMADMIDKGDMDGAKKAATTVADKYSLGDTMNVFKPRSRGGIGVGKEGQYGPNDGIELQIQMVLANCIKNPQAPGLLNALRHLVANRERHAAHDEEKAARKAAHDAAKASKGHGH